MITVTRTYQLGGTSTFPARDRAHLVEMIEADAKSQRESGDKQSIGYRVVNPNEAERLGAYETAGGEWIVSGTEYALTVAER